MVAITDGATIQISDRLPEQAEANRQIALRAFRFLATPPEYRDEAEAEAVFAPELEMLGRRGTRADVTAPHGPVETCSPDSRNRASRSPR